MGQGGAGYSVYRAERVRAYVGPGRGGFVWGRAKTKNYAMRGKTGWGKVFAGSCGFSLSPMEAAIKLDFPVPEDQTTNTLFSMPFQLSYNNLSSSQISPNPSRSYLFGPVPSRLSQKWQDDRDSQASTCHFCFFHDVWQSPDVRGQLVAQIDSNSFINFIVNEAIKFVNHHR
ncbi:hypothetical protein H5410_014101 [Solanum commersonii]|uniref:Uncharacterized protein n=1 Tax=Solanum commersonii TaxID=4109 RepID=A0A9J5ZPZ0_SOLCO|nr:hypothetical protein H5410_014101 [Solanum commersonii]